MGGSGILKGLTALRLFLELRGCRISTSNGDRWSVASMGGWRTACRPRYPESLGGAMVETHFSHLE